MAHTWTCLDIESQLINKSLLMHHLIFIEWTKAARQTNKVRWDVSEILENISDKADKVSETICSSVSDVLWNFNSHFGIESVEFIRLPLSAFLISLMWVFSTITIINSLYENKHQDKMYHKPFENIIIESCCNKYKFPLNCEIKSVWIVCMLVGCNLSMLYIFMANQVTNLWFFDSNLARMVAIEPLRSQLYWYWSESSLLNKR